MENVFHNTKQTRAQIELVNPAFWLARKMVSWNKQRAVKSKPTADTIGVTLPSGASAAARAICTSPTLARSALKQFIKPEDWPPVGCILQKTIDSWWISQSARDSPSFHINICICEICKICISTSKNASLSSYQHLQRFSCFPLYLSEIETWSGSFLRKSFSEWNAHREGKLWEMARSAEVHGGPSRGGFGT